MSKKVGRPLKYKTVEELDEAISKYFDTRTEDKPPTITGLALHLDFTSRQSIYDYKEKPEFTYSIKKARLICENFAEMAALTGGGAGPIFILKNYGWTDKQEIEQKGDLKISIQYED